LVKKRIILIEQENPGKKLLKISYANALKLALFASISLIYNILIFILFEKLRKID